MGESKSERRVVVACLALIVLSWGTNYPLMKLALDHVSPLGFATFRIVGGAVFLGLLVLAAHHGRLLPPPEERWLLGVVGVLQYAAVLAPAGMALHWLPPGRTVTIVYTMPIWAALFDFLIMRNRLCGLQWTGISISLVGLLLFLAPGVVDWSNGGAHTGITLAFVAAASWALGAVIYGSRRWRSSLLCQAFWQLAVAGTVLCGFVALTEFPPQVQFSPKLILILLWNWLVPVSIGVWAWGRVLENMPASIASQALLCTPLVGIGLSAMLFEETLPPVFAMSALLIMLGAGLALLRPVMSSEP